MNIELLPKEIADSYAIQALFKGTATEAQQLRAMKWIVYELCQTYGIPIPEQNERLDSFNLGKRYVGWVLVGIANISLGVVKAAEQKIEKRKVLMKTKGKPNG